MAKNDERLKHHARSVLQTLSRTPLARAKEAMALVKSAHDSAVKSGDRVLEAETLLAQGRLPALFTEPAKALEDLRRAELIFRANDILDQAASCVVSAARALFDLGQETNALVEVTRALGEPSLLPGDRALACITEAMCQTQLGAMDEALHTLRNCAVPLAEECGEKLYVMFAKAALSCTCLHLMIEKRSPALWPRLPGMPESLEPSPLPSAVLGLLDDAQAAMPSGHRWDYLEMSRYVVNGFTESPGLPGTAAQKLTAMSNMHRFTDPAVAAWAMFYAAVVQHHRDEPRNVLNSVAQSMGIAGPSKMHYLERSLLRLRVWAFERTGDVTGALITHKRLTECWLTSLVRTAPETPIPGSLLYSPLGLGDALASASNLRNPEPAHVRRAIRFMDEAGAAVSIDELVRHSGVSRRTLEVAFSKSKSTTLADFMKRRRMAVAAQLLINTDQSIREIAQAVGYRSPDAFARAFRDRFGALPASWRVQRAVVRSPTD